jgi:hypothetical protein
MRILVKLNCHDIPYIDENSRRRRATTGSWLGKQTSRVSAKSLKLGETEGAQLLDKLCGRLSFLLSRGQIVMPTPLASRSLNGIDSTWSRCSRMSSPSSQRSLNTWSLPCVPSKAAGQHNLPHKAARGPTRKLGECEPPVREKFPFLTFLYPTLLSVNNGRIVAQRCSTTSCSRLLSRPRCYRDIWRRSCESSRPLHTAPVGYIIPALEIVY